MIEHKFQFRVMYSDTDKMGTVHHSVYPKYYEMARWELFRSIGVPYKKLEDSGVMAPVLSLNVKYLKTIQYDALLTVHTTLKTVKGVRMWFSYQLYNELGELVNEAETELAFVNCANWKPCAIPEYIFTAIEKYKLKQQLNVYSN
jgi:acyl-CoA thioester hydrolase